MKPGIISETEGFDLFVNGTHRSFRDTREAAYAAARFLKSRNKGQDKVEMLDRSTGQRVEMKPEGWTG